MGQRLNIEIHDGRYKSPLRGRLVANAYYHWSGYSESAVELLQEALKAFENQDEAEPLPRAIRILEATGAGFSADELLRGKELLNTVPFTVQPTSGRNDGLIAITEKAMKETRVWEEGRIEIHLNPYKDDPNYITFNVFWQEDEAEFLREEGKYETEQSETEVIHSDFNFKHFGFDKVDELEELIQNNDGVKITSLVRFIK